MQGELHPPPPATATRLQSHPPPPPVPFHSRRVWGHDASCAALGAPLRYCPLPAIEERPLVYSPAARHDSGRCTPSSPDSATASVLFFLPSPHPLSLSPPPPPPRHSHCCVCPVPPPTLHPLDCPHLPTAIMAFVAAAAPLGRPSHCGTALTSRRPVAATPAAAATTRMATPPLNPEGEKDKASSYTLVTGAKVGLCRCYKSKEFPLCNGAHAGYNKKVRRGGGGKMGVALGRGCCSELGDQPCGSICVPGGEERDGWACGLLLEGLRASHRWQTHTHADAQTAFCTAMPPGDWRHVPNGVLG